MNETRELTPQQRKAMSEGGKKGGAASLRAVTKHCEYCRKLAMDNTCRTCGRDDCMRAWMATLPPKELEA